MTLVPNCDSSQCYAIIVGIEHYADSRLLPDLDGPSNDAIRYATWLRNNHVPAERVLALVSPLAQNRDRVDRCFRDLSIGIDAATQSNLRAVVTSLTNKRADLLLIVWSGHGALAESRDRRLFYQDATTADPKNLSLESLQRFMRAGNCEGLKNQMLLVDACANYLEDVDSILRFPGDKFGHDNKVNRNNHMAMYAAAAGEWALNLNRAGAFSSVVLDLLERETSFPGDVNKIGRTLREHFDQIKDGRSQTPVFYSWAPEYGDVEEHGDIPSRTRSSVFRRQMLAPRRLAATADLLTNVASLSEPNACAVVLRALPSNVSESITAPVGALFDSRRFWLNVLAVALSSKSTPILFNVLEGQLQPHELEPVRKALKGVVAVNEARNAIEETSVSTGVIKRCFLNSVPNPAAAPHDGDPDLWLQVLSDMMPMDDGVTPLSLFMLRLVEESGSASLSAWFMEYVETEPSRQDVRLRLENSRQVEAAYLAIMIRLQDTAGSDLPEVEAWLCRGSEVLAHWIEPCGAALVNLENVCIELVQRARCHCGLDFTIEFVLPRDQLRLQPELWKVPSDGISPKSTLGKEHVIVVRWRERVLRQEFWQMLQQRHDRITDRLRRSAPQVWWVDPQEVDFYDLRRKLLEPDCKDVLTLLSVPPPEADGDLLSAALAAGAPFVVFPHKHPHDWEAVRRDLELAGAMGITEFRNTFMKWRHRNESDGQFSLLWENPMHRPRFEKLTQPKPVAPL